MRFRCCLFVLGWHSLAAAQSSTPAPPPANETTPSEEVALPPTERTPAEAEARAAFERGLEAMRQERWAEAEAHLRGSAALSPRASTTYNLALVLFNRSRYRDALDALTEVQALAAQSDDARYREYGEALRTRVMQELCTLRVHVDPPDAVLFVDGELAPGSADTHSLVLDPGLHRVEATKDGYSSLAFDLVVRGGEITSRHIVLRKQIVPQQGQSPTARTHEPSRERPESHGSIGPWITVGAGAALLVGGVIAGLVAKSADDDFVRRCGGLEACDPNLKAVQEKALLWGRVSDVLLVTGGATALSGVVWVALDSRAGDSRNAARTLSVGVKSRF